MAKPPAVRTCTSAARKGESLNLGASVPKPMKKTVGMVRSAHIENIRAIGAGRQIIRVAGLPNLFVGNRVHFDDIEPWKFQIRDVRDLHKGISL